MKLSKTALASFLAVCLMSSLVVAQAEIASRFTSDAEGWSEGGSGGTLSWLSTGGNPAGHITVEDVVTPGAVNAYAPAKFHGDLRPYIAGGLSVDLVQLATAVGSYRPNFGVIKITGPYGSATLDIVTNTLPSSWTSYSASFDASAWGVSQQEWNAILSNVTELRLDVDSYNYTGDKIGLDNFIIAAPLGTAFCFGDAGSGTPCPCNNDNDGTVLGSGCANGVFASGAQLTGSGTASVSGDTLVLTTTHVEPSNAGLYFQAQNDQSPGNIWGDGLRCAGADLVRLQVRFADAAGTSNTTIGISAKAGNVLAGNTKYYQCWYRTTVNPPCGLGVNDFNSSNGYAITWLP